MTAEDAKDAEEQHTESRGLRDPRWPPWWCCC